MDLIQQVAEILSVDPLMLLSISPGNFIENGSNSPIAIHRYSHYQTTNEQHTQLILKLVENVVALNDRLITLLDKKEK